MIADGFNVISQTDPRIHPPTWLPPLLSRPLINKLSFRFSSLSSHRGREGASERASGAQVDRHRPLVAPLLAKEWSLFLRRFFSGLFNGAFLTSPCRWWPLRLPSPCRRSPWSFVRTNPRRLSSGGLWVPRLGSAPLCLSPERWPGLGGEHSSAELSMERFWLNLNPFRFKLLRRDRFP